MSSNHNDINNTINLNNYEEYFLLYTDNELDAEQIKMVDEFILANPTLKPELELFLSLRLRAEETNIINKKELMSDAMKLNIADDLLLLYIDQELTPQQEKEFEKKLSENRLLNEEYRSLLKTKLAPSEKINYPYKKELYRKTDRHVPAKLWIRIAAIFIFILCSAVLYFISVERKRPIQPGVAAYTTKHPVIKSVDQKQLKPGETITASAKLVPHTGPSDKPINPEINVAKAKTTNVKNTVATTNIKDNINNRIKPDIQLPLTTYSDVDPTKPDTRSAIDSKLISPTSPVIDQASTKYLNNQVTSLDAPRLTNEAATTVNNRKGSLKIFLRKATRMIEKRTGIEPSDDNDELLIGAVAVKLK